MTNRTGRPSRGPAYRAASFAVFALLLLLYLPGGASAQWATNGNNINNTNTGNVGVGTATPRDTLEVAGRALFTGTSGNNPVALVSDEATTNKILNPSAEVDTSNTTFLGGSGITITRDATTSYVGVASYKVTAPTPFADCWVAFLSDSVTGGATYTASAWVKGTAGQYVGLSVYDGVSEQGSFHPLTGNWQRFSLTWTVSPGAVWVRAFIRPAVAGQVVYVDAVQMEQKSYPTSYADGSLGAGYSWSGTANASASVRVAGQRTLNPASGFSVDTAGNLVTRSLYVEGGSLYVDGGSILGRNNAVSFMSNVGVGTANPSTRLQVSGQTPVITVSDTSNSASGSVGQVGPWLVLSNNRNPVTGAVLDPGKAAASLGVYTANGNSYVYFMTGAANNVDATERMRIDKNGNVGIGTTNPVAKLDVNGDINVTGNINAKYQDVAEWVPSRQKLAAGTVVVLDTARLNHVIASSKAYDTAVAGVISNSPGVILGEGGEGKLKVATTGRVRVKVDATRAAIKVGDLLVTSDAEGVAMKSEPLELGGVPIHRPGTLIGKALEPLAGGTGEILVLLSLQ